MSYDRIEDHWKDIDADSHDENLHESSAGSPFGDTTQPLRPSSSGDSVNPPRHGRDLKKQTETPFVKGPICRDWIVRASLLAKPALKVGMALYFKAGVRKDDFIRGKRAESVSIKCNRSMKTAFKISPSQMSRGLHALQSAGLIHIHKGGRGRCPVVSILNIQIPRNGRRKISY